MKNCHIFLTRGSARSMTKVATLTGHTYRVLYLAISPDGQTVVTGAGDETLRALAEEVVQGVGSGFTHSTWLYVIICICICMCICICIL